MNDRRLLLTGWKKDPYDPRDFIFRVRAAVPWNKQNRFTLVGLMPPVRDQGNVGSCVGFGIGANLTALAKQKHVDPEWFSPTWIYNGARFIEGTLPYDFGCYPRNAMKWIADRGCLREHLWPYNPNQLDKTSPPSALNEFANDWPILVYTRVIGGIDGICAAIASGHPVSIGNPWYEKWMDTNAVGVLPAITETDVPIGGHETIIYGYEKSNGLFWCQNSWGLNWGNNGRFAMPMSALAVFNVHGGYDAHIITVDWKPESESGSTTDPPHDRDVDWPWIVLTIVVVAGIIAAIVL